MDALDCVIAARRIMKDMTPLKGDCGRVCARACCRPDENGKGGMLLFPGEEKLYAGDGNFNVTQHGAVTGDTFVITCGGECGRDRRPLACMFFPLRPTAKGGAVMDRRSAWVCPLYEAGKAGLDAAFVSAAEEAAKCLCKNETHVRFLAALRERILFETDEARFWGRD